MNRTVTLDPLKLQQSAALWRELHGANAVAEARKMVGAMRAKGDLDGVDTWLRIIVAIEAARADGRAWIA
jgi:hypothetical protein